MTHDNPKLRLGYLYMLLLKPSTIVSPQNDVPPLVTPAKCRSLELETRDLEVSSPHTEDKSVNAMQRMRELLPNLTITTKMAPNGV